MQLNECPLCFLDEAVKKMYLNRLINNVLDDGYREEWQESGGLCPEHALLLLEHGSATGHAILYQDLIPNWQDIWLNNKINCPVCKRLVENKQDASKAFIWGIKNAPSFKKHYSNSTGLCKEHFNIVYNQADLEMQSFLITVQERAFQELNRKLTLLLRQHDYNFEGKKDPEAARAWRKAARYWSSGVEKKWRV